MHWATFFNCEYVAIGKSLFLFFGLLTLSSIVHSCCCKHLLLLVFTDFRGYGLNKISFLNECIRAGYTFAVLNKLYVVHLDHPTYSLEKQDVMKNASRLVYTKFTEYNEEKYGDIYKEIFCPECLLMEMEQAAAQARR